MQHALHQFIPLPLLSSAATLAHWSAQTTSAVHQVYIVDLSMSRFQSDQQDGCVVSRGNTGGARDSGAGVRCAHAFSHACFGMAGRTLQLFTNDTRRANASLRLGDWWGKLPPGQGNAGQGRRALEVRVVSSAKLQAMASMRAWDNMAMVVVTNWPEQNHLGHFTMVSGALFEYAEAHLRCLSDNAAAPVREPAAKRPAGVCGSGTTFWTMQPNDRLWKQNSSAWVRQMLPLFMEVAFGKLCDRRGEALSVRHKRTFPSIAAAPACTANLYLSAVLPDTDDRGRIGAGTRLLRRADWNDVRRQLAVHMLPHKPTRSCNLLVAVHDRRTLAVAQVRAAAHKAGFTHVSVLNLGSVPLREQLRAVAGARAIVTREGSHLANLVAAHSDTVLVSVVRFASPPQPRPSPATSLKVLRCVRSSEQLRDFT